MKKINIIMIGIYAFSLQAMQKNKNENNSSLTEILKKNNPKGRVKRVREEGTSNSKNFPHIIDIKKSNHINYIWHIINHPSSVYFKDKNV